MAGIWKNNPETAEGKYPIVLRRDGSVLTKPYFVLVLGDPGAPAALEAYAAAHGALGSDPQFVADVRGLALEAIGWANLCAREAANPDLKADPDAPPHRQDDPDIISWARRVHGHGAGA